MKIIYHMTADSFITFIDQEQTFTSEEHMTRISEPQRDHVYKHDILFIIYKDNNGIITHIDTAIDNEPPEHLTTDPAHTWTTANAYIYPHTVSAHT